MKLKIIKKILRQNKNELFLLAKTSLNIIFLSIFIGFAVNLFHPKGFVFISKNFEKNKNTVLISSEEAKIKKDSEFGIFIDSRQEDEFEITHIPGAINIPAIPSQILEKKIHENQGIFSMQKELVLYCDGASCGASQILANKLIEKGYSKHIYIIKNGFPEWESNGFPVTKTDNKSKK